MITDFFFSPVSENFALERVFHKIAFLGKFDICDAGRLFLSRRSGLLVYLYRSTILRMFIQCINKSGLKFSPFTVLVSVDSGADLNSTSIPNAFTDSASNHFSRKFLIFLGKQGFSGVLNLYCRK